MPSSGRAAGTRGARPPLTPPLGTRLRAGGGLPHRDLDLSPDPPLSDGPRARGVPCATAPAGSPPVHPKVSLKTVCVCVCVRILFKLRVYVLLHLKPCVLIYLKLCVCVLIHFKVGGGVKLPSVWKGTSSSLSFFVRIDQSQR